MPGRGPRLDQFSTLSDVADWLTTSGCAGCELPPAGIQRPAKLGGACASGPLTMSVARMTPHATEFMLMGLTLTHSSFFERVDRTTRSHFGRGFGPKADVAKPGCLC